MLRGLVECRSRKERMSGMVWRMVGMGRRLVGGGRRGADMVILLLSDGEVTVFWLKIDCVIDCMTGWICRDKCNC